MKVKKSKAPPSVAVASTEVPGPAAQVLSPQSPKPASGPYRILALDGGPAALLVVLMLSELERRVSGFLSRVDLIAGTSAGAITGLMLATKNDPGHMLPVAENFWLNDSDYYKNTAWGYLKALVGAGAVNDDHFVRRFLEQKGVLGERTLGELCKRVVATSFDMNPTMRAEGMTGALNWQPKIFHNLGRSVDNACLAVDVALCSSASPVVTPIHHGRVDGGLVANNPSMIAIAQVLMASTREPDADLRLPDDRHGIMMLSVGGGRAHERLNVQDNSWGYGQWLLNPKNPLLLVNAFLSASSEAVTLEAAEILDEPRFLRLDPFYVHSGALPFVQADPKSQQATLASPETQQLLDEAVAWLGTSGWMG